MEREITTEVMGTGTLEARVQTIVSSKISGRIAQMLADQGDGVGAGQVLAKLDDSELIQQVEIARSSLAAARAFVDRVEKDDRNRTALIPGKCRALVVKQTGRPASSLWMWR